MYDWIYKYFINTYWFLLICLSLPFIFGMYLFYKAWKDRDTDSQQNQQDQQGQQGQQNQSQNQSQNQNQNQQAEQPQQS